MDQRPSPQKLNFELKFAQNKSRAHISNISNTAYNKSKFTRSNAGLSLSVYILKLPQLTDHAHQHSLTMLAIHSSKNHPMHKLYSDTQLINASVFA